MEKATKFYPNKEYNHKKRVKFFALSAVFVLFMLMMNAWFISSGFYFGLVMNALIVLIIALIPKTLKENPIDDKPVCEITESQVKIAGKTIDRDKILWVKGVVYLGSVGNLVENRNFLEECATSKPLENMLGSLEVAYKDNDKNKSEVAIFENISEAVLIFVKEGKVEYRLGYSLGKDYRVSTYNLKEALNEKKPEPEKVGAKQSMKHLI